MFKLQGGSKNMTVARQIDRRLWSLNLFLTFSRPTYLHMFNSWNKNHKILLVLAFPKCDLPFCCQYYRRYIDYWEFCSDFNQGRIQEFVQGGLKFFYLSREGCSAPAGVWKTPEIKRFYWSRGGLAPIALISILFKLSK